MLEELLTALRTFEEQAAPAEKKDAIIPLHNLAKKLQIRSLELQEQRWMLTAAESARDRQTLRDLADYSQFEDDIKSWALEILNLKPQPRTLPFQNINL